MNEHELFSNSIYEEQTHLAERELAAFIDAVKEFFGPEQARASTEAGEAFIGHYDDRLHLPVCRNQLDQVIE